MISWPFSKNLIFDIAFNTDLKELESNSHRPARMDMSKLLGIELSHSYHKFLRTKKENKTTEKISLYQLTMYENLAFLVGRSLDM